MQIKNRRYTLSASAVLLSPLLFASVLYGQQITGEISGTVVDQTGARIPNASVVVTNSDTKEVARTLKTNGQGIYDAPLLKVGNYSVTAALPGFSSKTVSEIEVTVSSSVKVDLSLVAGATEAVEVTETAAGGETQLEDGAVATVITSREIPNLALNTRNFEQIVQLQPGVVYGGDSDQVYTGVVTPSGATSSTNLSINGLRGDQNAWTLDGADMLAHNTGTQVVIHPSPNAIGQIKTLRNSYGAQYGGGGNAQIEVITKAGTSAFNGEFHVLARNSIFNANDYFAKRTGAPKPDDQEYTGGFTLGGPLAIPHLFPANKLKTFFFYALETKRDRVQTVQSNSDIPTPAQLQGIFTDAVCQYPTTTSTTCKPTQQITNIDPVASEYIKDVFSHIGTPNNPNDAQGVIQAKIGTHNETEQMVRLDHAFGQRFATFFRYIHDPVNFMTPNGYGSGGGYPGLSDSVITTTGDAYLLHATYTLSNSTVVDGFVSYEPFNLVATPVGALATANSPDVQLNLPFPSTLGRLPTITFQGGVDNYGTTGPAADNNENFQASFNLFHSIGRHNVSIGANWELYRESVSSGGLNAGVFNFESDGQKPCNKSGAPSPCTNPTTFEQAMSAFLQGRVNYFQQSNIDAISNASIKIVEGYLQDDWKIQPRLNLNAGVRYSYYQQPHEAGHHLGSFDPSTFNPATANAVDGNGNLCTKAPCAGGVLPNAAAVPFDGFVTGGVNSAFGEAVSRQPYYNFAPRLGFAWDVYGNGKTAFRGGYGVFFSETQLNLVHNSVFNNPSYVQNITYTNPTSFFSPGITSAGAAPAAPNTAYGLARDWHSPYTQGYSLGVQQQFPKKIYTEVTYSGNVSTHLVGQVDINQPAPGQFVTANLYGGTTKNGTYTPTVVTNTNTPLLNEIRPYQGYGVIVVESPEGVASYNGLQTVFQKRFGPGSTINLNYTWSSGLTNTTTTTGRAPENTFNRNAEYGPITFNRRHVFVAHFNYQLPIYKKQSGWKGETLGGWQVAGIIQAASGLPLTITTVNVDPAGQGLRAPNSPATNRPDQLVADANAGAPHSITGTLPGVAGTGYWFNVNNFANVPAPTCPAGQLSVCAAQARPGNSRNGAIRGPGYQVWNASLFKDLKVSEHSTLQFRVEAFNIWNHTNFQSIATKLGAGGFGQIASDRDPRQMQLEAKYSF